LTLRGRVIRCQRLPLYEPEAAGEGGRLSDRVLIVDDEEFVRRTLADVVRRKFRNLDVEEAVDGRDALDKIRASSYGMVFSDLAMPRMNGLQLLECLHEEFPALPVVVVTAWGGSDNILRCFSMGAWDYILKPFTIDQVAGTVRRALIAGREVRKGPGDMSVVSMGPGWLEITAASEIEYVHRFRRFTELLLEAEVPENVREDVRFAIEEIGRNAMEWGNRFDPDRRVRLAYRLETDRVVVRVEDEGRGFNPDEVPDPSVDPSAHIERRLREGKRVGGYGIHLVRKIMDEVIFDKNGTAVTMTKYLYGKP
jgi:CheY-like chemotaxis protein